MLVRISMGFLRLGNYIAVSVALLMGVGAFGDPKLILPVCLSMSFVSDLVWFVLYEVAGFKAKKAVMGRRNEAVKFLDDRMVYSFYYDVSDEYVIFTVEYEKLSEFFVHQSTGEYMFFGEVTMEHADNEEMKNSETECGPGFEMFNVFSAEFDKTIFSKMKDRIVYETEVHL